jgi:hypothetical protein
MTTPIRLSSIRLYPGEDDDLIAWYQSIRGTVNDAVRETLRRGIAAETGSDLDLAAIRNVVEAALDEKLAGLKLSTSAVNTETDETDTLLDTLAGELLL